MRETYAKSRDSLLRPIIIEVISLAILLRDSQETITQPKICQQEIEKILKNQELRLLLINLDPCRIPQDRAEQVLNRLYSCSTFRPETLQAISCCLYYAIRHIEAVCQKSLCDLMLKAKTQSDNLVNRIKQNLSMR